MDRLFSREALERGLADAEAWLLSDVLIWENLVQLLGVLAALGLAWALARPFARAVAGLRARLGGHGRVGAALEELEQQALALSWLAIQWLMFVLASGTPLGGSLIEVTVSLLAAWVVIQFASALVRDRGLRRAVAILAWTVAALNVLGWLAPVMAALDSTGLEIGGFRLTVMGVIRGLALFAVLLWAALLLARTLERRLGASPTLSPSVKVLFGQLSKIVFVTVAVVVSLAAVGVDLTAFAVFTGALGIGLGLGLQKVVANLFSGVLLLMDRSIKPGDVIAIGETYGTVNFMGARYVSVITRDGVEYLIPNENLVTSQVENWSYSNDLLRVRVPVGVSYDTDLRKAMALILEAAAESPRALDDPKPLCQIKQFGDSSVDLEARVWIDDPAAGVGAVKSDMLLRIWDKFHQHGIEIPYPQRDIHIRSNRAGPLAGPGSGAERPGAPQSG